MHQYHKALELMLKAIELAPKDPVMQEHLGDVYHSLGNRSKAREAYQKALEFNHEQPEKIQEKIRNLE
jgi:Flp pilus assembly protein TadD